MLACHEAVHAARQASVDVLVESMLLPADIN